MCIQASQSFGSLPPQLEHQLDQEHHMIADPPVFQVHDSTWEAMVFE